MTCDVSIIIVSWKTREPLRNCLCSLRDAGGNVRLETFVVDNASGDGTVDMVRVDFPEVMLICNATNRGFAAANNQALARATGRYLLLLNPDTIVLDHAIAKVIEFADAQPKIGVVGCQVLDGRGVQRTCFSFPGPLNLLLIATGLARLFPRSRLFGRPHLGGWDRTSERTVDVISGMFMLVRREALLAVGPMDEDYFVYGEEADWCWRFWKAGWPCVFTPRARIEHVDGGSKSTEQVRVRMFVQLQKSLLIFHRKNLGWLPWAAARVLFVVSMTLRSMLWGGHALLGGGAQARMRAACAVAALRFHLSGVEPATDRR